MHLDLCVAKFYRSQRKKNFTAGENEARHKCNEMDVAGAKRGLQMDGLGKREVAQERQVCAAQILQLACRDAKIWHPRSRRSDLRSEI
jgi:hypothetical protein